MIVCLCLAVSDQAIQASIAAGAVTFSEVTAASCAGTGCGSCVPAIERMIEDAGLTVAACQP
jgi:bacterioferritin-associated ferredoxin